MFKINAKFQPILQCGRWRKCAIHNEQHTILLDIPNVPNEWKIYSQKIWTGKKARHTHTFDRLFFANKSSYEKKHRIWTNKKTTNEKHRHINGVCHTKKCDVSVKYTCSQTKKMYSIGNMVTTRKLIHTIRIEWASGAGRIVSFANARCISKKSIVFILSCIGCLLFLSISGSSDEHRLSICVINFSQ